MKKLGLFILAALVMNTAGLFSQPMQGDGFRKFVKDLKLTETQKKDVDKIHVDMEKKMTDQKAKNGTAHLELRQLLKADNPDRSAIEKKLTEAANLNVAIHMIRIDSWFAVNKLLTPEQQKTWKKALEAGADMGQVMMKHGDMKGGKMKGHGKDECPPQAPQPSPTPQ